MSDTNAELLAGIIGAQTELDRQAREGELFYRDDDGFVDGRIDLAAIVRAVLEHAKRVRDAGIAEADGWEEIGEGGGKLWEIHRGARYDQIILGVRIAPNGKTLFVKIGKPRLLSDRDAQAVDRAGDDVTS